MGVDAWMRRWHQLKLLVVHLRCSSTITGGGCGMWSPHPRTSPSYSQPRPEAVTSCCIRPAEIVARCCSLCHGPRRPRPQVSQGVCGTPSTNALCSVVGCVQYALIGHL